MWVARFPRRVKGVGVLAIPNEGLDRTRRVESANTVLLGDGVLRLLFGWVAVGVLIDHRSVVVGVEVMA
jgi:hypothetical protein